MNEVQWKSVVDWIYLALSVLNLTLFVLSSPPASEHRGTETLSRPNENTREGTPLVPLDQCMVGVES